MSRAFTATSDRITQGTVAIPTTGMFSVLYYPTYTISDGIAHYIFEVTSGGNFFHGVKFSDNKLYFGWFTGGVEKRVIVNAGSTGLNTNAWNSIVFVWTNGGVSELFVNNISKGTTSSLSTWNTATVTRNLGNGDAAGGNFDCRGNLAQYALWNAAGDATDVSRLNAGWAPSRIKAANLVDYIKLLGTASPEPNQVSGATAGTLSGTSQGSDPTIYYAPSMRFIDTFIAGKA